ncbi:glutamine--fructose-6-phosphate transaminase (isomerizing) [Candidatus Pelagisphaera phototrophica]|uniref:glutamine--fructose-6-phosphate transaminase (isomerizing) n=1 Tax=Candidatus Pelagisphaera phototrophica TaxID=2684113 RepID=UPI0019F4976D|nr:glutamine--fructose-6-phosphate transaminase (isomerizing) [Candidatus Pelagisphaera phototrophica]QXD32328.1 glutamine--fructose-6-phosphate transaminase (isomerizing) [Candidatus Pelagisphaera phototrophica]
MCGIVGYIGKQEASPLLLEGLKRLEYRGYDSAGVAVLTEKELKLKKHKGRVTELAKHVSGNSLSGNLGICHTRWATHGAVTEENAHPHVSFDGKIAMVHNGVIENYLSIKKFLEGEGYSFYSETDSEVFCNLIAYHYAKEDSESETRFPDSVRRTLKHIEGTYGIAVICADHPTELVGARKGSPLIVGIGPDEYLLASDVSAIIRRTSNVVYLNDGEIVSLKNGELNLLTNDEEILTPEIKTIDWDIAESELGDYEHYMLKEIFEQSGALENAMRGRFSDDMSTAKFGGLNTTAQELRQIDRILLCACGTAWHACLVGEYLIERFARIPVEVEYASEFRYRNAPLDKNTLVLVISQSGETIDTLAALRESKRKGYKTLAINNSVGSTIARESDGGIYQHAGPEIGVASTKAFTSQLHILSMLALYLGRLRDMSFQDGLEYVAALKQAPELVTETVKLSDQILEISKKYKDMTDCLFLGRQDMFPIALEGALKLKEISYIHAEGYPAAEMKHGPIALISAECPVIVLATQPDIHEKLVSNIQEVKARGAPVIAIANRSNPLPKEIADDQILIPDCHRAVLPILASIPTQLLSYHIANLRGCDVDKPRNLAKSVTVE